MKKLLISVLSCLLPLAATRSMAQSSSQNPDVLNVAAILGIESQLEQVQQRLHQGGAPDVQMMMLRQELYMATLAASLDVDSVLAEIDNESAHLSEMQAQLQSRRDHALSLTTIGNIIAGAGGSIVGTAMQFKDSTAIAGDGVGVASGGISTALQIYSLHQQHGGSTAIGRVPNMLAPFFGRTPVLQSNYPDIVWRYLNTAPAASPQQTRVQDLISQWVRNGRVGPPNAPASQAKIVQLTASMRQANVGIDVIGDRLAMLADVRGRIALMKRDLATLLRSTR